MKKYLICGLGNIGEEYSDTRHNIGFTLADALALAHKTTFTTARLAAVAQFSLKGRQITLIKPSTFMNLSGKSVSYWLQHEGIDLENLLVIADDVALPLGELRLRKKGGAGGHNGLLDIEESLQSIEYSRLRFGIGNDYPRGMQVDYVLGKWFKEQKTVIIEKLPTAISLIESFVLAGPDRTMTQFNKK